jgi:hypothetical protein
MRTKFGNGDIGRAGRKTHHYCALVDGRQDFSLVRVCRLADMPSNLNWSGISMNVANRLEDIMTKNQAIVINVQFVINENYLHFCFLGLASESMPRGHGAVCPYNRSRRSKVPSGMKHSTAPISKSMTKARKGLP